VATHRSFFKPCIPLVFSIKARRQYTTSNGDTNNSGTTTTTTKGGNGKASDAKNEKVLVEDTPDQKAIAKLTKELEETKQELLIAMADRQNSIRIARDDVRKAKEYGIQKFATTLFDVNDILERALESVKHEALANNPDFKTFYEGVQMTEKLLLRIYEQNDIKRTYPLGLKFDPNVHQALQEVIDPSKEAGTVCYVMKAGYQLKDRLLRAASVVVVKPDPTTSKVETPKDEETGGKKEEPVASS